MEKWHLGFRGSGSGFGVQEALHTEAADVTVMQDFSDFCMTRLWMEVLRSKAPPWRRGKRCKLLTHKRKNNHNRFKNSKNHKNNNNNSNKNHENNNSSSSSNNNNSNIMNNPSL